MSDELKVRVGTPDDIHEAMEKLRRGQYIMVREGTAAQNMESLLPLFRGQTDLRRLTVERPDFKLLRDRQGRANWDFSDGRPKSPLKLDMVAPNAPCAPPTRASAMCRIVPLPDLFGPIIMKPLCRRVSPEIR